MTNRRPIKLTPMPAGVHQTWTFDAQHICRLVLDHPGAFFVLLLEAPVHFSHTVLRDQTECRRFFSLLPGGGLCAGFVPLVLLRSEAGAPLRGAAVKSYLPLHQMHTILAML